jgi:hypothetical protein
LMKQRNSRRFQIVVVIAILVCVSGYFVVKKMGQNFDISVREITLNPTTIATVRSKEYVRFDHNNHSYVNDLGDKIERRPGDEQWRVYYEFDNLDQVEEPRRSQLLQVEKERIVKIGPRFAQKSKDWFEKTEVGDKLEVRYHPIGDRVIEIVSVTNPKYPKLQ